MNFLKINNLSFLIGIVLGILLLYLFLPIKSSKIDFDRLALGRENSYLIAFLVLIGFFLVYLFKVKILPIIKSKKIIFVICDLIFIMFVFFYVIFFFRSINQFIYFQF